MSHAFAVKLLESVIDAVCEAATKKNRGATLLASWVNSWHFIK
jgi:hypothetical protein